MRLEPNSRKEQIFDIAIRMFAQDGFENVSMRDIAAQAGITAASIYNHFSSKEEILGAIYLYFGKLRVDLRKDTRQIKAAVETGSALDVLTIFLDPAITNHEEKIALRMVLISKIIMMRIFNDPKANQFFLHEMFETDMRYMKKWLGYAVEIGRLAEEFDIENFSIFYWRQLIMMGIWAFADPNYEVRILDEEAVLLNWFAGMLPLKNPARPI
ncbi:MAG: TetR/AcrR family transcriptional regulator [Oscillospiraceae bacterium]|nr:TetR/AcrR family transcriptional regulator [Oscillospiraceae bacterium]